MMGLTHFFDNALGGSAHGVSKGGLTPFGREVVARVEQLGITVNLARASDCRRQGTSRPPDALVGMLQFTAIVPVLRVADVARSQRWYQEILGFSAVASPGSPSADSCRLQRDHTELMLRRASGSTAPRTPSEGAWDVLVRLNGDALITLLDEARRRTPLVRGPELMPDGAVEFELEDPDGHRVCISEVLTDTRGIPRAIG
jgi:catechol 2,3-dioxygenase-like lactoylglutathione lyase family enzyme